MGAATQNTSDVADQIDATKRIQTALDSIMVAQSLVNDAASAISTLRGFAPQHAKLCNLYQQIKSSWHYVNNRANRR